MADYFPEVQGGGSLILAWQVKGKRVLVVGGGEVAAGRILNLLNADALVTVVCPSEGLNPEVRHRIAHDGVKHIDRVFLPLDIDPDCSAAAGQQIAMVLVAVDDAAASTRIYKHCKEQRIPANIADVPPECDFYFGSVHRDGPLQVMVSTNGNGPRIAAMVRRRIASNLPSNTGAAIKRVGLLRRKLRRMVPEADAGPKRMGWMSNVCEKWTLEQLCDMTEDDMDALLRYYEPNEVPSFSKVKGSSYLMDSSYAWTGGVMSAAVVGFAAYRLFTNFSR